MHPRTHGFRLLFVWHSRKNFPSSPTPFGIVIVLLAFLPLGSAR
jgi:hypothetical protein